MTFHVKPTLFCECIFFGELHCITCIYAPCWIMLRYIVPSDPGVYTIMWTVGPSLKVQTSRLIDMLLSVALLLFVKFVSRVLYSTKHVSVTRFVSFAICFTVTVYTDYSIVLYM